VKEGETRLTGDRPRRLPRLDRRLWRGRAQPGRRRGDSDPGEMILSAQIGEKRGSRQDSHAAKSPSRDRCTEPDRGR